MVKLGQTTTGNGKGVKYLWLVKDMEVYKKYSKKECYAVMAFNGNGWWTMFNGTLKACRDFIGNETIVDLEANTNEELKKESEESKTMKEEKVITKQIVMSEENYNHCKNIANELEKLVNGNFVNVDGEAVEVQEDEDGNEFVTVDGEAVDADEFEPFTLYDYFADCLDIKYTVTSDLDYSGVSVMVTCGGPNIYIDTNCKKVLLYWWTDYAEYELASDVVDAIDSMFEELYQMRR